MAAPSGHFRRRSRDRSAHRLPPRHVGGRQDGAEPGGGPRGALEARPRARPRLGPPGAGTPAGGAEDLRSLPFRRGRFPGRPGRRAAGPEAAQRALRALPAALLPPLLRPLRPLHRRGPLGAAGGEGGAEDPAGHGPAEAEPPAAALQGHGEAAAVPQGRAQGHPGGAARHPALRQLLGHRPDVFFPPAAPDPLFLDAEPAAGVPGRLPRHPQRRLRRGAAEPGPGRQLPARAPAPNPAAGALHQGAAGGAAAGGRAVRPQKPFFGAPPGAEQAARVPRESPEPCPVPHPPPARLHPEAPPARPRPGDPAPGPGPAAPGLGAALRGGAEGGLLPAGSELDAARPGRVQSVAGAVAAALLQAASVRGVPAGQQHGPADPQLPQGQGVSTGGAPAATPRLRHRRGGGLVQPPPNPQHLRQSLEPRCPPRRCHAGEGGGSPSLCAVPAAPRGSLSPPELRHFMDGGGGTGVCPPLPPGAFCGGLCSAWALLLCSLVCRGDPGGVTEVLMQTASGGG